MGIVLLEEKTVTQRESMTFLRIPGVGSLWDFSRAKSTPEATAHLYALQHLSRHPLKPFVPTCSALHFVTHFWPSACCSSSCFTMHGSFCLWT